MRSPEPFIVKRRLHQALLLIYLSGALIIFLLNFGTIAYDHLAQIYAGEFRNPSKAVIIRNLSGLWMRNQLKHLNPTENPKKLIYWYSRGRLGNLMFQYAALYSLAKDTGTVPALLIKPGKLKNKRLTNFFKVSHIELPSPVDTKASLARTKSDLRSKNLVKKVYNLTRVWDSSLASRVLHQNYDTFTGFPNSYKYFNHHTDDIFREFRFVPKIQSNALKFLTESTLPKISNGSRSHVALVGVHVRRTDMLKWTHNNKAKFGGSKMYVEKAMDWYRNYFGRLSTRSSKTTIATKFIFVMCSDDLPWCMRTFKNSTDIIFCRGRSAIEDLAVLANCHYSIITQGTFGWWGAYLARSKVTLYPTNYFAPDSPQIVIKGFTYETKYPTHWIGLPID